MMESLARTGLHLQYLNEILTHRWRNDKSQERNEELDKNIGLPNSSYPFGPNSTMQPQDPLCDISGPITRSRAKRIKESLATLIQATWAKEELKLNEYSPYFVNVLIVNVIGPLSVNES